MEATELLNKADRLQAEMRIAASLNQARCGLNGFSKTDVVAGNTQHLAARFVVFNNLKP